jgi:acyl dehydratase
VTAWPHGSPRVGDRASMTRTVEDEDIVRFTAMSGDRNPVHDDAEAAARTRLGDEVVIDGTAVCWTFDVR